MESFQEKGSQALLKKRKENITIATLVVEQCLSMLKKEMMMMMKTPLLGEDCLSSMEGFQEKGSQKLLEKRQENTTITALVVEQWLSMLKKKRKKKTPLLHQNSSDANSGTTKTTTLLYPISLSLCQIHSSAGSGYLLISHETFS
ncbi:unnamed protein product [Sphagnum jensenii]|uniref:Uncharacterized protein n=1 Tax=Sphagnum jensenii TaxID=128206 RepID=A0ABP0X950_9BRYO